MEKVLIDEVIVGIFFLLLGCGFRICSTMISDARKCVSFPMLLKKVKFLSVPIIQVMDGATLLRICIRMLQLRNGMKNMGDMKSSPVVKTLP